MTFIPAANRERLHQESLHRLDSLERIGNAVSAGIDKLEDGLALLDRVHLQALADRLDLQPSRGSAELRAAIRRKLVGRAS